MQESVYREKSSGTDIIELLQLKWTEITKAFTGRYSVKIRNGIFGVLFKGCFYESRYGIKNEAGRYFLLHLHMQVFPPERDK